MPLYPGARETVARLDSAGWLLGIATGKARRGLDHFLVTHGLKHHFVATRTADDAASKPHPQMLLACIAAAGVEPRDAVMVGDTEFDMAMACAAGCRAIVLGLSPRPAGAGGGCRAGRRQLRRAARDARDALGACMMQLGRSGQEAR